VLPSFMIEPGRVRLQSSTHQGTRLAYTVRVPMTKRSPTRSRGSGRAICPKVIVFLSIASLSITLASRFFQRSASEVRTIAAKAGNAKIQHRDRMTQPRCAPFRTGQLPFRSRPVASMHAEEENLLGVKTAGCLYNRPPPRA
jgi:hypothetical protein